MIHQAGSFSHKLKYHWVPLYCLCYLPRSMVCSEGSVGMPQNMMLVSMVQSSREKQQDTRCTRVKVLQGGRLMTENQMWPSLKSFAVFMKNRLLEVLRKSTFGFYRSKDTNSSKIPWWCEYYLNLFKSMSVATGNTLSRVHSPTSTASQELHRKCHFWPLSRSCTITLLTYLQETSVITCSVYSNQT